jgi:hypothetical protein
MAAQLGARKVYAPTLEAARERTATTAGDWRERHAALMALNQVCMCCAE